MNIDNLTLQRLLLAAGCSPGALDGIWGADSQAALSKFLSKNSTVPLGTSPDSLESLFFSCLINPENLKAVGDAARTIEQNLAKYAEVAALFIPMPPYVIGLIHCLEAAFNFETFLANGDPLKSGFGQALKTTHVPAGLGPCNSWQEAAVESLKHQGWRPGMRWDIGNILFNLRAYNGTGYELYEKVNSPYLWSMTNHYSKGKYVSDGRYDADMVSQQPGCAAIMIELKNLGITL